MPMMIKPTSKTTLYLSIFAMMLISANLEVLLSTIFTWPPSDLCFRLRRSQVLTRT